MLSSQKRLYSFSPKSDSGIRFGRAKLALQHHCGTRRFGQNAKGLQRYLPGAPSHRYEVQVRRKAFLMRIFCMLFAAVLFAFWSASIPAAGQSGPLDGKMFVGEFGKKWEKAEGKDEIIFQDGKFHSAACDRYGFGDGAYTMILGEGMNSFVAETASAKEGKIQWRGRISGDIIEVNYTWYKAPKWYRFSKAPIEYWFKGELKK